MDQKGEIETVSDATATTIDAPSTDTPPEVTTIDSSIPASQPDGDSTETAAQAEQLSTGQIIMAWHKKCCLFNRT